MTIDVRKYQHYGVVQDKARTKSAGGWTEVWSAIGGQAGWFFAIETASSRAMERVAAGGAMKISTATRVLEGRYHPDITTDMRILEGSKIFSVTAVENVGGRDEITRLVCEEVVP